MKTTNSVIAALIAESKTRAEIESILYDVKSDYGSISPATIYKNYRDLNLNPADRVEFIQRSKPLRLTMLTTPLNAEFSNLNAGRPPDKKPAGLWYACGIEWILFAREEYYTAFQGRDYLYHLDLDYTSMSEFESGAVTTNKVLQITSQADVDKIRAYEKDGHVDWAQLEQNFGGIEICPITQVSRTKWGNYWDVDSGCIWNGAAIKNAVLLT